MKTILIAHNYTENSFAYMSYYLAHHLAYEGYRVIFISHKPFFKKPLKEIIEKGELMVYSWPTQNRPTKLSDAIWFAKIYMQYKPSVVISHFVNVNITTVVSKLFSWNKVKIFPYYHTLSAQIQQDSANSFLRSAFVKYRKQILYRFFTDSIICPSDLAKEDLKENFKCSNGIKVLNPMKDRFKNKDSFNSDAIIVSYLGRLDPSKGVIDLINAFLEYKKKLSSSKIILNIAGSGNQYNKIKELTSSHININFIGGLPYNEIDEYLNKSHYTIIPSKFDALNMVGIESMMNQTALLISNTTGLSAELTDGVECFKFNTTIEEMILLFEKVEKNSDNHLKMGENARKIFLEKFAVEIYCKKMKKIIDFCN